MSFEFLSELNESTQYRSKHSFKKTNAREISNHVYMDLIALWILYNEYEFAPDAISYANKTATFNNFRQYRQMGTDLYQGLHVLTQKRTDLVGKTDADRVLMDKITLNERMVLRYLRWMGMNQINESQARQVLQRVENSLHIEDSNYRSIRRLAQNWPNLTTSQKRTVLTRMIFFYRTHAFYSEIFRHIKMLAKSHNFVDPDAKDPEKRGSAWKTAAITTAATAGAAAAGYHLGKRF